MSLLPGRYDIKLWKGATFSTQFIVYTDEGTTPRNLTGCIGEFKIMNSPSASVLLSTSPLLGGVTGTVDVTLTDEQTGAFAWSLARYELAIVSGSQPAATRDVYVQGQISVLYINRS